MFKKQPLDVDTGSEDLDDIPDDAAEYMMQMGLSAVDSFDSDTSSAEDEIDEIVVPDNKKDDKSLIDEIFDLDEEDDI